MSLQKQPLLQFNNISVSHFDHPVLTNLSGSICVGDKIGLIGINGSGKSTLLNCIANRVEPDTGSVLTNLTVSYVPQLDLQLYKSNVRIFEYLQNEYENWWEILMQYESLFGSQLSEDRILATLSGGEIVKLNIAKAFFTSPQLLLLDEPTNHLDLKSLRELKEFLHKTKTSFVLVSHNIDVLNAVVDTIWELEKGKLTVYGGNYDFYKDKKALQTEAEERKYVEKKQELKKLKLTVEQENIRASRSKKVGTDISKKHDRSTDRFATGFFKDASENSRGIKKAILEKKEADLQNSLKELKSNKRNNIYLELNTKKRSGLIASFEECVLSLPNGENLIDMFSLSIYHGDRIAIFGDNGSGKTTLVKQFSINKHNLIMGTVKYGLSYNTLYVDQKYDFVNPKMTILENMQSSNSSINYESIRRALSNLGFPFESNINVLAGSLSGGETARLAFAMAASTSIDLLILDEPTNNLDIETIATIIESLRAFQGTLIVVSHDIHFLQQVAIDRVYAITNNKLAVSSFDNLISSI